LRKKAAALLGLTFLFFASACQSTETKTAAKTAVATPEETAAQQEKQSGKLFVPAHFTITKFSTEYLKGDNTFRLNLKYKLSKDLYETLSGSQTYYAILELQYVSDENGMPEITKLVPMPKAKGNRLDYSMQFEYKPAEKVEGKIEGPFILRILDKNQETLAIINDVEELVNKEM
jgi:hypothetical protein